MAMAVQEIAVEVNRTELYPRLLFSSGFNRILIRVVIEINNIPSNLINTLFPFAPIY